MARYTGPKRKLERREGVTLFGSEKWKKRPTPPGQHGASSKGRSSSYSIQFREKQKTKRVYGILEKQFRGIYEKAKKATGNTGLRLMQLLELRLDNVVFKLGLAKTRAQARQIVRHGHIQVNGKKLDIPSYTCKVNDTVQYLDKFVSKSELPTLVREELKTASIQIPSWLAAEAHGGKLLAEPARDDLDRGIRESFIIEFYSR
jgi:small subunit ribosomal protein S4